jgi:hypothetical protein
MSRLRTVPAAAAKSPAERLRAAAGRGARSLAPSPDCSAVLSRPQRKVQRRAPRRHAEALSGAARRRHASLESNICRGASTVLAAHPSAAASDCSGGHQRGECRSKPQPFVLFRVKKSPRQSRKVTRVWVVLALILLTALTRLSRAVDPASADRRRQPEPILSARRFVTSQSASVVRDTARADVAKAVSLSLGPQRSNPQMKALILNGCARSHHRIGARRKRHRIALFDARLGTRTPSGRPLHDGALTNAHKTLPFGSRVRVTNHANGRSVVVTTLTPLHPFETSRSESEASSTLTFEGASVRDTKTGMRSPSRLKADGMASRYVCERPRC